MLTAEDNFRVEVWDADERELIETIARSSDHLVSVAAWHAAVRRRPGMLLIHRNASFTMDRMVAPGEPEGEPCTKVGRKVLDGVEAMLGDLRSWHSLRAWCHGCGHHGDLGVDALRDKLGTKATLSTVERRLRCRRCGKGPVQVQIFSHGRG
ncbi:MAG: hypothetical protein M9939_20530 [Mesorhizobium sp.]|nr:hypothetical protein [Mesorhizobium sp.]MCO5163524.1 hypothetical protein [Mesorhizobium sp.]